MQTVVCCVVLSLACLGVAAEKWFVVNEDNDHFFKCDSSEMTEKGLADYIDYVARGKITHFFMCVNGQRTSYDSKTWEPIWRGIDEPTTRKDTATRTENGVMSRDLWPVNAKILFDAGIDPYVVWIRHLREKGVSPWISMRMNDVHFCNVSNYFRNTTFYRTRHDLWIDPTAFGGDWLRCQLDYVHKEVRDYTLAQVKEIAERWDSDGIELDFMRFGNVFKPGEERRNAPLLDAFMRTVRRYVDAASKRHGRRMQIAVRIPYDPDICAEYGFNVVAWAKEGLVDVVIPDGFITLVADLPVREWKRRLKGFGTRLVAGLGCELPKGSKRHNLPAVYRGLAEKFYGEGADGVYAYNLPYKSCRKYATDSRLSKLGMYCKIDVAAELYETGLGPEDLVGREKELPAVEHDYPKPSMSHHP